MKKTDIFICKSKGTESTIIQKFNRLAIFYGCTVRFLLDLVGILEDKFSRDAVQIRSHRSMNTITVIS